MTKKSAKKAVSTFADLPELIAQETATPEFEASFGDPMPLSIIEHGDEPGEHDMPEPFAAQKVCGELMTSLFLLLEDTRLSPLAPDIAWGIVNSFHFVAGTLQRREDGLADKIREMTRRMEPGEVFNKELEDLQLQCQSVIEQREAVETMRDYTAAMYRTCWRRAWGPSKGSKASSVTTASYISAVDFLRERALAKREKYQPDGLVVVSSGPAIWDDWKPIWDTMSAIKQRTPRMIVVTTGQRTGWDAIVAAWCAREGVPLVAYALTGRGKAAFARNRKIGELDISEAVLGEGSGIQANLYQMLRKKGVPIHAFRKPADAPKQRKPEASDAHSFRRARRYA